MIKAPITSGYRKLYVLFLGKAAMSDEKLSPGHAVVLIRNQPEFSAEGTLNSAGALSGMARLYSKLSLKLGDEIQIEITGENQLTILNVTRALSEMGREAEEVFDENPKSEASRESVFQRRRLKPIHIELFAPENLNRWNPENEPDVYMAFGVLQEYTRFRYCCATSQSLLTRLGFPNDRTKPDAILISEDSGEYLVAEFKMRSSAFKSNHQADDIDVLIVWEDDETDRTHLPPTILSLREIARSAAQEIIAN